MEETQKDGAPEWAEVSPGCSHKKAMLDGKRTMLVLVATGPQARQKNLALQGKSQAEVKKP